MKRKEIEINLVKDENVNQFYDTNKMNIGTRIYIELSEKGGNIVLQKYYNTVNRVPDVSFKYTGEYQNVVKYLYDKGILTDWDLTPEWVNVGAWERGSLFTGG